MQRIGVEKDEVDVAWVRFRDLDDRKPCKVNREGLPTAMPAEYNRVAWYPELVAQVRTIRIARPHYVRNDGCRSIDARTDLRVDIAVRLVGVEDAVNERAYRSWQHSYVGTEWRALLDDVELANAVLLEVRPNLVELELHAAFAKPPLNF